MSVKSLIGVFPYEVEIGLGPTLSYVGAEYGKRVADSLVWLVTENLLQDEQWKILRLGQADAVVIGFNRTKDALRFKLTWG